MSCALSPRPMLIFRAVDHRIDRISGKVDIHAAEQAAGMQEAIQAVVERVRTDGAG